MTFKTLKSFLMGAAVALASFYIVAFFFPNDEIQIRKLLQHAESALNSNDLTGLMFDHFDDHFTAKENVTKEIVRLGAQFWMATNFARKQQEQKEPVLVKITFIEHPRFQDTTPKTARMIIQIAAPLPEDPKHDPIREKLGNQDKIEVMLTKKEEGWCLTGATLLDENSKAIPFPNPW